MSTNARGAKRTGGRASGPRQSRGGGGGGRSVSIHTADGAIVLAMWLLLAGALVVYLAGPGRALAAEAWSRVGRWVTHDVRDPVLDEVPVAPEGTGRGYSRAAFGKGWAHRDGCAVDQLVAQRDVHDSHLRGCAVAGGTVTDPYDGTTTPYRAGAFDVDHVVSLAEAWRSGAARWTPAQRETFANDPDVLLLVKASENRSKGDRDAGTWQPATSAGRCLYAQRVRAIKYRYLLTVDSRERAALDVDLAEC